VEPTNGDYYAFATDLLDEGVDSALDEMLEPPGMTGVTMAVAYHTSRDVFPHNPRRTVGFLDAGCYFRPQRRRYRASGIDPVEHESCTAVDPLEVVRGATAGRGAALHAWLVCLHDVPAGATRPDLVQRNMFDDPLRTELCPANPSVRAYLSALVADLTRYGCDSLIAESLHYHPFRHGYHHERCFVELDAVTEFLLGLCFCEHCTGWASSSGVDVDAVRRACLAAAERALIGEGHASPPEPIRDEIGALAGGEMAGFLRMREDVVSTLVAELVAGSGGMRFCYQDPTGSVKGYATGEPQGGPAVDTGWQFGIDATRIGASVPEYRMLGYARDPGRLEREVRSVRRRVGTTPLSCVLRPAPPDADGAQDIRDKLAVLGSLGVADVGFYHYGLLPRSRLAHVAAALDRSVPAEGAS